MPSFLAKTGSTARASFLYSQCWSNTASSPSSLVRVFHSSQLWCEDAATPQSAKDRLNARRKERYTNDPEHREKRLQCARVGMARMRATRRPQHVQQYINDPEYRELWKERERLRARGRDREALRQAVTTFLEENRNNYRQKNLFHRWFLRNKWTRRLVWETHDPLVTEGDGLPASCASCGGACTRRLWWRRKIADEKTGEQLLDCHNCFCDKDWEKALPLGYRGHVFGFGTRIKHPDWANYPPSGPSP